MKPTYDLNVEHLMSSSAANIIVGSAFAFIKPEFFDQKSMNWIKRIFKVNLNTNGTVVPLLGRRPADLPGATLTFADMPSMILRSITADKMIYQTDIDSVNLAVFEPAFAARKRTLIVKFNGNEQSRHTVALNANGLASLMLRELAAGEYEVHFDNEKKSDMHCHFSVAEYKLVPLNATLIEQEFTASGNWNASIKLASFGTPVTDEVRIELIDGVRKAAQMAARCENGVLNLSLTLEGSGPHQVSFQLVSDAAKTASLPIVGSRKSERESTLFSPLGEELQGSLLPTADSREVHGIYLHKGSIRTTPVSIKSNSAGKVELSILQNFQTLSVVSIDPMHPVPMENCVSIEQHPSLTDENYVRAEDLFGQGKYADALAVLQEFGRAGENEHAYWEYLKGCCYAHLGEKELAMTALRQTVINGYDDFQYLQDDEDLKSLQAFQPFIDLCNGGIRVHEFGAVAAGSTISCDVFAPACIVTIGGFIDDQPWEGWTTSFSESKINCDVSLDEKIAPGKEIEVTWKNVPKNGTVYCVIKDKRLITTDNQKSRLASAIKNYVADMGGSLTVGNVTTSLQEQCHSFDHQRTRGMFGAPGASFFNSFEDGAAWGSAGPIPSAPPGMWAGALPAGGGAGMGWGAATLTDTIFAAMSSEDAGPPDTGVNAPMLGERFGSPMQSMRAGAAPLSLGAPRQADCATVQSREETPWSVDPAQKLAKDQKNKADEAFKSTVKPEVLFAGFVESEGAVARLKLQLPDAFVDYTIESFVTAHGDWQFTTTLFRAEKTDFVELNLPMFSTLHDQTRGTIYTRATEPGTQLTLKRNGEVIELTTGDNQVSGATIHSFVALPGEYSASLFDKHGALLDAQHKVVLEPGKMKYRVNSLRFLSPGESIEIDSRTGVEKITIIPGISTDFTFLVDATADYSHCCCEQTASKILSACAMYMFAGGDGRDGVTKSTSHGGSGGSGGSGGIGGSGGSDGPKNRKARAEAIIIAGIEREITMWKKGQGLTAYPGLSLCEYYGKLAAYHLSQLKSLQLMPEFKTMSHQLKKAIATGLEISADVFAVQKIQWPPVELKSSYDAYAAMINGDATQQEQALTYVRKLLEKTDVKLLAQDCPPQLGRSVYFRQQTAYAAAVLLRSKQSQDNQKAFQLADIVTRAFNAEGRLYSTVDSTAAIALLSELKRLQFGSDARVSINNGAPTVTAAVEESIQIQRLNVLEGSLAAHVTTLVEEDWSKLASTADIAISITHEGTNKKDFKLADSVELKVTIGGGYKDGDLVWIYLPEALSRVYGGAQLKVFSLDFQGASSVTISLAATGSTINALNEIGTQHMAVCLRNMFDEERCGNPGLIPITVR